MMAGKAVVRRILLRFLPVYLTLFGTTGFSRSADPDDKRPIIREIFFIGNQFVSERVLASLISSTSFRLSGRDGIYDHQTGDADVAKLTEYYRGFGFADVKVTCHEFLFDFWDPTYYVLQFTISEGKRCQIQDAPQVVSPKAISDEQLEQILKKKAHSYFDNAKAKIDMDERYIRDYPGYGPCRQRVHFIPSSSDGALGAVIPSKFEEPCQDTSGVIPVKYMAEEHRSTPNEEPAARVGQIFLIGNTKTRMSVILRQVHLFPGQILDVADVRKAEANLRRLDRFGVDPTTGVGPTVTLIDNPNDPKSEYKDLLVTVVEKETINYYDEVRDELEEWCSLFDVRTLKEWCSLLDVRIPVMISATVGSYLWDACRR